MEKLQYKVNNFLEEISHLKLMGQRQLKLQVGVI